MPILEGVDLHRMATEYSTSCSHLTRKYTTAFTPPLHLNFTVRRVLTFHTVCKKRSYSLFYWNCSACSPINTFWSVWSESVWVFAAMCVCLCSPVLLFFFIIMCVCSGRRLERVEQVVGVRCRLFDVEEQGVHPALPWHRGQRLPGARPPVFKLYQRAVPTEWVHYHPHTADHTLNCSTQWYDRKYAVAQGIF